MQDLIISLSFALSLGIIIGILFHLGRTCTNTALRNLFIIRNNDISITIISAVLVLILGYQFLALNIIPGFNFVSSPLSFTVMLPFGAFLFGISMVFAGGCAGGVCYRIGEGNTKALIALIGYALGIYFILSLSNMLHLSNDSTEILLDNEIPSLEMILPRWFWTSAALILFFLLLLYVYTKKETYLPHLKENWSPLTVGILIGITGTLIRAASSILSNRQFGVSTVDGIIELFSPFFSILVEYSLPTINWAGVFILGLIIGAFIASYLSKELSLVVPTRKDIIRFFLGGFTLGFSAMLAGGCNIGHIFGGLPELGLSSIVALIFMFFGSYVGNYTFYIKMKQPLPKSTPQPIQIQ